MERKRFDFIDLTVILIWVFIIFKLIDYYFVQIVP